MFKITVNHYSWTKSCSLYKHGQKWPNEKSFTYTQANWNNIVRKKAMAKKCVQVPPDRAAVISPSQQSRWYSQSGPALDWSLAVWWRQARRRESLQSPRTSGGGGRKTCWVLPWGKKADWPDHALWLGCWMENNPTPRYLIVDVRQLLKKEITVCF